MWRVASRWDLLKPGRAHMVRAQAPGTFLMNEGTPTVTHSRDILPPVLYIEIGILQALKKSHELG